MLRLLARLWQQYSAQHLRLELPASALPEGPDVQVLSVRLVQNRLEIRARSTAGQLTARLGGISRSAEADSEGLFALSLPYAPGQGEVRAEGGGGLPLPGFSRARRLAGQIRILPGFLGRFLRAFPAGLRRLRDQSPEARKAFRDRFGLAPLEQVPLLTPGLFALRDPGAATPDSETPFCLVMPVHDAFALLQEALERLRRHTPAPWQMVLVEDCSPDPRVRPWLRDWVQQVNDSGAGQVTLLENGENLGFVGAANRGLERALEALEGHGGRGAVVLLNSDALLPANWAPRLLAPIAADASVASVTPMSNNAELLCVPQISRPRDLPAGLADQIDAQAARLNLPAAGTGPMPTGVGFCMALSEPFLRQVGLFDPAFGPGYGEEVDWCQRAMALGGRHVAQPGLFVEHRGGASFGSAEKQRLLRKNGALLLRRYPGFDLQVQNFIAEDPLIDARMALGLAEAAARARALGKPVPVYLAHSLGGGAEMALRQQIARDLDAAGGALVLRVGGRLRWQVELQLPGGQVLAESDDTALIEQLVALLPARRIVYSCGVGDSDPVTLPAILLRLSEGASGGVSVLFHDYLPLSPSYTLLGSDGAYRGVPMPGDTADPAHGFRRPDGTRGDLADWRAAWAPLIARAERLEVFSNNSRGLVATAFPEAADKIVVTPHRTSPGNLPVMPAPEAGGVPVIGVLGNIAPHKGADVLARLSRHLAKSREARLVLLGNLDPAYRLAHPAVVHGDYQLADLPTLVRHYQIGCWLIPSVWPETFSFTTHEALASGLPVLAFDLGAQGDLVRGAGNGHAIPFPDGRPDLGKMLDLVRQITQKTP